MGLTWMLSNGINVAWPARWLRMYYAIKWMVVSDDKRDNVQVLNDYLYTINSGLFLIDDDSIDIATQDNRDGGFILSLCRFTQIHHSSPNA